MVRGEVVRLAIALGIKTVQRPASPAADNLCIIPDHLSAVDGYGRCYAAISTNLLRDKADGRDLTKQYRRLHQ